MQTSTTDATKCPQSNLRASKFNDFCGSMSEMLTTLRTQKIAVPPAVKANFKRYAKITGESSKSESMPVSNAAKYFRRRKAATHAQHPQNEMHRKRNLDRNRRTSTSSVASRARTSPIASRAVCKAWAISAIIDNNQDDKDTSTMVGKHQPTRLASPQDSSLLTMMTCTALTQAQASHAAQVVSARGDASLKKNTRTKHAPAHKCQTPNST
mmetsp:Transcript_177727/g.569800  ORF Transcript_177727/g.569800 Transcript_177727/m.569800 type:complete len:211 (-) Transcript_177727:200-832(-)